MYIAVLICGQLDNEKSDQVIKIAPLSSKEHLVDNLRRYRPAHYSGCLSALYESQWSTYFI
jgi:hypothetical protein